MINKPVPLLIELLQKAMIGFHLFRETTNRVEFRFPSIASTNHVWHTETCR